MGKFSKRKHSNYICIYVWVFIRKRINPTDRKPFGPCTAKDIFEVISKVSDNWISRVIVRTPVFISFPKVITHVCISSSTYLGKRQMFSVLFYASFGSQKDNINKKKNYNNIFRRKNNH